MNTSRRQFLASAGATAVVTALGGDYASALGLRTPRLEGELVGLGEYQALADLFEETSPSEIMGRLVAKLREGATLDQLVSAGALANARSMAGSDYEGYHAFMGMYPSLVISRELPEGEAALPVLKTLKRSAVRMHKTSTGMYKVEPKREDIVEALRVPDLDRAHRGLAATGGGQATWEALQGVVNDHLDVHMVVFAWRAKEITALAGEEHGLVCMRQMLKFAYDRESRRKSNGNPVPAQRNLVPKLIEDKGLTRDGYGRLSDEELSELADVLATESRASGAEAVAEALKNGAGHESIGEALSLAGTRLLLRDPGRMRAQAGKPIGSVHGASTGVHATDSALAWREIAATLSGRSRAATLITGAYHTAGQGRNVGKSAYPYAERTDEVAKLKGDALAGALAEAARGGDQPLAGAIAARMNELGQDEALFKTLRPILIAQDGALHAEKYHHTQRVHHAASRPAFQGEHLIALARVAASQACLQAPEVEEARELLSS